MSERTYYVYCEDNCRFEAMTKQQVINAIAEATGATPTSVDDAFITMIKEQNGSRNLKFWVGTQAQYNALTPANDVVYIITDGDALGDISARVTNTESDITVLQTSATTMQTKLNNIVDWVKTKTTEDGWKVTQWNGGKMEAVKTFTQSIELTAFSPLYRSDLITINYPIGIFDTVTNAPIVTINDPNNFVSGVLYGNNDVKFRVYGAVAGTNSTKITVRIEGT